MGATTLTAMVNSVFAKIDESNASANAVTQKSRPEIQRTVDDINDAYSEVWIQLYGTLRPQAFDVVATQAGVSSYALPSALTAFNIERVHTLTPGTEGGFLKQTSLEELSLQAPLVLQGNPTQWYRYGDMINFYPVPSGNLTIRVFGSQTFVPLLSGGDTTVLPEEFDKLLRFYAIATAKAFWRDPDAKYWLDLYRDGMNNLKAAALRAGPRRYWRTDLDDGLLYSPDSFLADDPYDCV